MVHGMHVEFRGQPQVLVLSVHLETGFLIAPDTDPSLAGVQASGSPLVSVSYLPCVQFPAGSGDPSAAPQA